MSESYYMIRDIIKSEYKEHYGFTVIQKILVVFMVIGIALLFLGLTFFNTFPGKISIGPELFMKM